MMRTLVAVFITGTAVCCAPQTRSVLSIDEKTLREYTGVYRWHDKAFLYLQMWSELTGKNELVAFDESGQVRTLYPTLATGSSLARARRWQPLLNRR